MTEPEQQNPSLPSAPRTIVPLKQVVDVKEIAPLGVTGPVITGGPAAHLNNHGGPVIPNVQVQTVFWGAAWQQAAQSVLIPKIGAFFTSFLQSSIMDVLAEYSISGSNIGHGTYLGTVTVTSPTLGSTVTDAQIQQALQGWIQNHTVVPTTANTLYFIYLAPNVTCTSSGGTSCIQFCGYHNHINGNVFYALVPFITCGGCSYGTGIFDSLTKVSSHELSESVTDPDLNAWWDSNTGNEIGDICNGNITTLNGYTIQTEWSNLAGNCVVEPQCYPWLKALYQDLLNRAPDAGGLSSWAQDIQRGQSLDSVANGFLTSQEYCTDVITGLYKQFLKRAPDSGGLASWVANMQAGHSLQSIILGFCTSTEYSNDNSGNSPYVESLYENLLGRASDPGGKASYVNELNSGTSKTAVVQSFLASQEYCTDQVTGLYHSLLGRAPDAGGLAAYVGQMAGGTAFQQIQRSFLDSTEYQARAVTRFPS
jgi:hypothetical protein